MATMDDTQAAEEIDMEVFNPLCASPRSSTAPDARPDRVGPRSLVPWYKKDLPAAAPEEGALVAHI